MANTPTPGDFAQKMAERTDDELLTIVEKEAYDYQVPALEAAKNELTKRGIAFNQAKPFEPLFFAEKHYVNDGRFWDYLIDYIILAVLFSLLTKIGLTGALYYIAAYVIWFLYYFLLESLTGKSIGKMLLGMKVLDINGEKPSTKAIALRSLIRLIPIEPLSFIIAEGGWAKDHTFHGNWHDKWSKTYTVRIKTNKE